MRFEYTAVIMDESIKSQLRLIASLAANLAASDEPITDDNIAELKRLVTQLEKASAKNEEPKDTSKDIVPVEQATSGSPAKERRTVRPAQRLSRCRLVS